MKKTILYIVLATLCLFFKAFAQEKSQSAKQELHGKIIDEQGLPLPGATIKIANQNTTAISDNEGKFNISTNALSGSFLISFVGYRTAITPFPSNLNETLIIQLRTDASSLNEVQVIGYGQTTKRLNTGSVSTILTAEIEKQPITNILSALSGRMPGVFVQTTNGLPGGNVNIQIRGKGSITAGTAPLYIIDGVPFGSAIGGSFTSAGGVLGLGSVNGTVSPFNSLNPDDIESISILKDADASSIYGSRGSNGVVLITTKKGKAGKTKIDLNVSQGIDKAASLPRLLNLAQYLQIRNEAFKNDELTPSNDPNDPNYAPDLTVWDTKKSTDWAKYLIGGTGHITDVQASISGGSEGNSFNIGGNFHSETTYLTGDNLYQRGGIHFNFNHTSLDKKFFLQFNSSLLIDNNQLSNPSNVATDLLLPPNYPLYDATGNYNWFSVNPVAETKATSLANTNNIVNNVLLSYKILPGLTIKTSAGYNQITLKQTQLFPTVSLYPGTTNYTNFGDNSTHSYIIEPQITYDYHYNKSTLNALVGGTYQNTLSKGSQIIASDFSSESLMNNFSSAGTFNLLNSFTQYKYESVFGRATYNYDEKYLLNATVRRDGSSRFGPVNQFGNFGSVGAAWIFSGEEFVKNDLPFISFGKLRASYGLTGNDQIADYQYLSTYGNSGYTYQDLSGLKPNRIANAQFHWETTRKLEFGLDLGILKDRLLFSIDYYRNRSDDQLVNYKIPYLTGFATYQANLPADVQNKGWEFDITSKNIQNNSFTWKTTFNLTMPKNTLLSFDNLATSSYAQTLLIGYDITRIYGIRFTGIDPATGLANYAPPTGSTSSDPYYYNTIGKRTPDLYGGIGNSFTLKRWQLDIFGQFAKQKALGGLLYSPGLLLNNYTVILNRWKPGDQTNVPLSSNNPDYNYTTSSANYFDASYFRIKNVALSYTLPAKLLEKIKMSSLSIYFQGQNLFTIWHKDSALLDPESGATPNLPPAKTFTTGIRLTL
ncbi:SusC/RagA family TonB-linked outer membrane protein [Mucilaginibacter sp. UYCu711]|uniref:SusC/RagA family TonB-linked outer membrane protein n=1 Tax=Mucilaginibacter sp. UYCu711 TaxID=3156339 RepID=UPI003D223C3E